MTNLINNICGYFSINVPFRFTSLDVTFDVVSAFFDDPTFSYEFGSEKGKFTPYVPCFNVEEITVKTAAGTSKEGKYVDKKISARLAKALATTIMNSEELRHEISQQYDAYERTMAEELSVESRLESRDYDFY